MCRCNTKAKISLSNRHLNNKGQDYKTDYYKGKSLTGKRVKEGRKESECGQYTFYIRMNIEFFKLLKPP
jgi:hypothetical protein